MELQEENKKLGRLDVIFHFRSIGCRTLISNSFCHLQWMIVDSNRDTFNLKTEPVWLGLVHDTGNGRWQWHDQQPVMWSDWQLGTAPSGGILINQCFNNSLNPVVVITPHHFVVSQWLVLLQCNQVISVLERLS